MSRYLLLLLFLVGIVFAALAIASTIISDQRDKHQLEVVEERDAPPVPTTLHPDDLYRPSDDYHFEVTNEKAFRQALREAPPRSVIELLFDEPLHLSQGPLIVDRMLTIRPCRESGHPTVLSTDGLHGTFHIVDDGILRLQGVTIKDGAHDDSPAIINDGLLFLDGVKLVDNRRPQGPAAIASTHRLVATEIHLEANHSDSGPGAIEVQAGAARFQKLSGLDNHGERGGLLVNSGVTYLTQTYASSNKASEGGALFNAGQLHIRDSSFWENRGTGRDSFGGALLNEGRAWVTNTTFSGNRATFGSAVVVDQGHLELAHVTFENNPNMVGSDLYVGPQAHLKLRNSVLSRSAHTAMSVDVVYGGTLESGGGNIVPQPDFMWPGDHPEFADHLGRFGRQSNFAMGSAIVDDDIFAPVIPLADGHVGRGFIPGSRCRDAYDRPLTADQLGQPRPIDYHCDAGAHQLTTAPEAISSRDQ